MSQRSQDVFLCRGEGRGKCRRYPSGSLPEVLRLAREMSKQEAVEVWTGYVAPHRLVTSLGPESQFGRRRAARLPRKQRIKRDHRGQHFR